MTIKIKMLALGAGFAALAAASPATAQYYPYRYSATNMAAQRCTAAVQNRLNYRDARSRGGWRDAYRHARVVSVTRVNPNRNRIRVRGLASSGRYAYRPYGVGAYGMLGANYAVRPDLSFRCSVDYRGRVRDVDINRR